MYAAVIAVLLAAVLVMVSTAIEAALIRSTAERLTIEAGLVATGTGPGRSPPRATDLAAGELASVLGGSGTAAVVLDPAGGTLAEQGNGAPPAVLAARLDGADYTRVVEQGATVDAVRSLADQGRALVVAVPIQLRAPEQGGGNGNGNGNRNWEGWALG
jgi:hypothetical protein